MRIARRPGDRLAAYVGPWLGLDDDIGGFYVAAKNARMLVKLDSEVWLRFVGGIAAVLGVGGVVGVDSQ